MSTDSRGFFKGRLKDMCQEVKERITSLHGLALFPVCLNTDGFSR